MASPINHQLIGSLSARSTGIGTTVALTGGLCSGQGDIAAVIPGWFTAERDWGFMRRRPQQTLFP